MERTPIDDFLGCVLWHLGIAHTVHLTTFRILSPYSREPFMQARIKILNIDNSLRAITNGEPEHKPLAREKYMERLNAISNCLTQILHMTPTERLREYHKHTGMFGAREEEEKAILRGEDDTAAWRELVDAWAALRDAWATILEPLPYLHAVWERVVTIDPDAFWKAYWDWMLRPHTIWYTQGRHRLGGTNQNADAYIARLPQTVPLLRQSDASRAACQRALESETTGLHRLEDWSVLESDRAKMALIATDTEVGRIFDR